MDGFWVFLGLAGIVFVFLGPIGFFLTISDAGVSNRGARSSRSKRNCVSRKTCRPPRPLHNGRSALAQPAQPEEIKPEGEREAAWENDGVGEAENPPRGSNKPSRSNRRRFLRNGHGAVSKRRLARAGRSRSAVSRWPSAAFCSFDIRSNRDGSDPARSLASSSPSRWSPPANFCAAAKTAEAGARGR